MLLNHEPFSLLFSGRLSQSSAVLSNFVFDSTFAPTERLEEYPKGLMRTLTFQTPEFCVFAEKVFIPLLIFFEYHSTNLVLL